MKYTDIQDLKPALFKRLVGVKREVFDLMVTHLSTYKLLKRKHPSRGKRSTLTMEDQILMMLMYYREYRTFFHVGLCYGLSESQCWRVVTETESILLKSNLFHVQGKKSLHQSDNNFEIVVVDVSEHPVERPKKNSEIIIQGRRNGIQ